MGLHIIQGDILSIEADAIVNSTNTYLIGFSGVDQLIHKLSGQRFEEECQALAGSCYPGEAVHTNAYLLHAKYIIHTVVPAWNGGLDGEAAIIRSCYRSSLELAERLGCQSIAFPLICAGSMGCPVRNALEYAVKSIRDFFDIFREMEVYLVLHGSEIKRESEEMFGDLDDYIEKMYVPPKDEGKALPSLDTLLSRTGEDFHTMFTRLVKEKGYKMDSRLYNKAYLTRANFNKIKHNHTKKPTKATIVKLAMAMELSYEETVDLLASAGLAFSGSSKSDIVIGYFFKKKNYDLLELEITLEDRDLEHLFEDLPEAPAGEKE